MKSQHSSTIAIQNEQAASRAPIDEDENMDDDDDDAMSNDNGTFTHFVAFEENTFNQFATLFLISRRYQYDDEFTFVKFVAGNNVIGTEFIGQFGNGHASATIDVIGDSAQ